MPKPNTPTSADPRFTSLGDVFNDPDDLRPPAFHETEGRIHAAVSLVLRGGPELEVLLIRRAESEGDPWSGHMALPGGRRDDSDTDLQATAIRETLEETGVCLAGSGVPLGSLPPLIPSTSRLPPISIFPFVFGVEPNTPAEVASPEVAEVLWASLSLLRSPEAAVSTLRGGIRPACTSGIRNGLAAGQSRHTACPGAFPPR